MARASSTTTRPSSRRSPPAFYALFAGAAALALVLARRTFVGVRNDDADYVLGALSLLPGVRARLGLPAYSAFGYHWPGLSLVLAPFAALFAPHWEALKVVPLGLTFAAAAVVRSGWGVRLRPPWDLGVPLLFLFNPWTLELSGCVMTEPLFLLLALLAFALLDRARRGDALATARLSSALTLAAVTRPEGLALLAAVAAGAARERRWRLLGLVAAPPLLTLGAIACVKAASGAATPGYWLDLRRNWEGLGLLWRLRHGLSLLTGLFSGVMLALPGSADPWILGAGALLAALCLGVCVRGWRELRRSALSPAAATAVPVFAAGHLFIHWLWPVVDGRFLWLLLPFALAAFASGCRRGSPSRRPPTWAACRSWRWKRSGTRWRRPTATCSPGWRAGQSGRRRTRRGASGR